MSFTVARMSSLVPRAARTARTSRRPRKKERPPHCGHRESKDEGGGVARHEAKHRRCSVVHRDLLGAGAHQGQPPSQRVDLGPELLVALGLLLAQEGQSPREKAAALDVLVGPVRRERVKGFGGGNER